MERASTPRVTVAMLGARMHYAVPRLLHEAGLLERLFADSYVGNKPWLEAALKMVPVRIRPRALQRWLGRSDSVLPPAKVTSFEALGLWYGWARRGVADNLHDSEVARNCAIRFNRRVAKVGLGSASVVWGFNGAALELFEIAKREGRQCVLEQTILPKVLEARLLAEEQQRWPGWEQHETDWTTPCVIDGREEAEWALADAIVAGSEFVRDGLVALGVAPGKVHVVPYGVDPQRFAQKQNNNAAASRDSRALRILFAGAVGLRKGIPDLLQALQSFNPEEIEVKLAGGIGLYEQKLQPFSRWAQFLGPVPRQKMASLFQWADVFVLPSIVEGSATVTYEAMMSGCPVIATPNAGSIVRNGLDGFIVPIRAPETLAETLRRYLDKPELLAAQRAQLWDGSERASLERYKSDLVKVMQKLSVG